MTRLAPVFALVCIFLLCFICYWPGLQGGFLFDDYANLSDLGIYGGVTDWETFKSFVLNGWSGPTGRPIALASFLIDDNTWPSHAAWFKSTNLLIHQLCGLLLCWCTLLLLRLYEFPEKKAIWGAVLTSAFWLLHPYFVSTTLYVVQRMAQLAALFSLLGMLGYLKGRLLLTSRPVAGYVLMSLSVSAGTLLATFSKENGVLLPFLLLIVEFCNPSSSRPASLWRAAFLWLPSAVVVVALLRYLDFSDNPWPNRPFNQVQRLLSESRIVSEYLYHLWVPRIEGHGLFQDGYQISTGLLTPISTLLSMLCLAGLIVFGLLVKNKWPLLSFAILFFFVGHLTESTVVGLELYFEHRNYLSALFLFLPLAGVLIEAVGRISVSVVMLVAGLIISMLSLMTWQRAQLWSNSEKLELYWAYASPNSPRAQNSVARHLSNNGHEAEAERWLEDASRKLPSSALLTLSLLLQKVYLKDVAQNDFLDAGSKLSRQPFDAQAVMGLRALVEYVAGSEGNPTYHKMTLLLINKMETNAAYNQFPLFLRLTPYMKAQILAAQRQPDQAFAYYSEAMTRYADTDAALMMVAEMASRDYLKQALRLLDQAEALYQNQSTKSLKKSRKVYDSDIQRLRVEINKSINESK